MSSGGTISLGGGTTQTQSSRDYQAMVSHRHSLLGGGTARLSGGTTQRQAAGGGTAHTLKSW